MSARFEIVRTDAEQPWHARRVANGRITWTTETYARKVGAQRAIDRLVDDLSGGWWFRGVDGSINFCHGRDRSITTSRIEVRHVDERGQS